MWSIMNSESDKTATYWIHRELFIITENQFDWYITIKTRCDRRKKGMDGIWHGAKTGAVSKQGDKGNELVDLMCISSVGDRWRDNLEKSQKTKLASCQVDGERRSDSVA